MLFFEIVNVYKQGQSVKGYTVKIGNQKEVVMNIKQVLTLFYNEGYKCTNASLISSRKGKYIRGLKCSLPVVTEKKVKKVVTIIQGVYSKNQISGISVIIQPLFRMDVQTKRYMYNVLMDKIAKWQELCTAKKDCSAEHSYAISGVRRIGKTTILRQLYNTLSDVLYIDGTDFNGRMSDVLYKAQAKGVKYILVDEVCKLQYIERCTLESFIKCGNNNIFFVMTGSVPDVVESIAESISDCNILAMPSIMYAERLSWENQVDIFNVVSLSTHQKYLDWLRIGELKQSNLDYVRGIVNDTLKSYTGNEVSAMKILLEKKEVTGAQLNMLFAYIIGCQLVYIKNSDNTFCKMPNISSNTGGGEENQNIKSLILQIDAIRGQFGTKVIQAFCEMLESARLVRRIHIYDERDNKVLQVLRDKYSVPAYVFEYPQLIKDYFNTDVDISLQSMWVEYSVLIKASYYYQNVGKYRIGGGTYEVDVLYSINPYDYVNKGIIEVKNRKERSEGITKYLHTDIQYIKEFVMTCKDVEYKEIALREASLGSACRMRNDILVLLLELAYINNTYKDGTEYYLIKDLYKKFVESK